MKNLADCDECRTILDEFRNSLGEVEKLRNERGDKPDAIQRWLAGEGGADLAPNQPFVSYLDNPHKPFASYFDNPRCPGFARAMQRMLAHYQRTGHYISVGVLLT
jgi:hypothetical protein